MPEVEIDPTDETENSDSTLVRDLRAQIKAAQKAAKEAQERSTQFEADARKAMFYEAGVPVTAQTKYFIRGYDGELETEAIRTAAIEAGYITDPASETVLNTHDRIANAGAGATSAGDVDVSRLIAQATNPAEVEQILLEHNIPLSTLE